jgi:copper chaperone CopZ
MKEESTNARNPTVVIFQISGMSCSCEAKLIEKRLKALPGVESYEINPVSYRMKVSFDPGKTDAKGIQSAVAKTGMKANRLETKR